MKYKNYGTFSLCKCEKTQNVFILILENASKLHLDKYNISVQENKTGRKGDFPKPVKYCFIPLPTT